MLEAKGLRDSRFFLPQSVVDLIEPGVDSGKVSRQAI
jgi:hypothetical protein